MNKLSKAVDTPWKIWNEISMRLNYPWMRWMFAVNQIPWGQGWRFYGAPIIQKHRRSTMRFGRGLQLRSSLRSNPGGPYHPVFLVTFEEGACLEIGDNFAMSGGVLCATQSIRIGNNVDVGLNTIIMDSDFHSLDPKERLQTSSGGVSAGVVIEDDVFIGINCLIMKGVTIGKGSVIGGGSIVPKSIPPGVIAAGNPARIIKEIPVFA
jgi:acetyltransferase-like isoleucine patch superfamily enzyme